MIDQISKHRLFERHAGGPFQRGDAFILAQRLKQLKTMKNNRKCSSKRRWTDLLRGTVDPDLDINFNPEGYRIAANWSSPRAGDCGGGWITREIVSVRRIYSKQRGVFSKQRGVYSAVKVKSWPCGQCKIFLLSFEETKGERYSLLFWKSVMDFFYGYSGSFWELSLLLSFCIKAKRKTKQVHNRNLSAKIHKGYT